MTNNFLYLAEEYHLWSKVNSTICAAICEGNTQEQSTATAPFHEQVFFLKVSPPTMNRDTTAGSAHLSKIHMNESFKSKNGVCASQSHNLQSLYTDYK